MALVAVVAALVGGDAVPAPVPAPAPCRSRACVERVAMHRCAAGALWSCVHRAALHWRVSRATMARKIRCENPRLVRGARNPTPVGNEHASGPVQFLPSTWRSTPYASRSLWTWKWASLGMAWMHHVHRGSEWSCQ